MPLFIGKTGFWEVLLLIRRKVIKQGVDSMQVVMMGNGILL